MNEYLCALLGGGMIGLSASLLLLLKGRIFGVSGILAGIVAPNRQDLPWKAIIILGLLTGGVILSKVLPQSMPTVAMDMPRIISAGLLVGFGTQLGGGCTSGHGICGLSRLSVRSMIATLCFMAAGILTVLLTRQQTI